MLLTNSRHFEKEQARLYLFFEEWFVRERGLGRS